MRSLLCLGCFWLAAVVSAAEVSHISGLVRVVVTGEDDRNGYGSGVVIGWVEHEGRRRYAVLTCRHVAEGAVRSHIIYRGQDVPILQTFQSDKPAVDLALLLFESDTEPRWPCLGDLEYGPVSVEGFPGAGRELRTASGEYRHVVEPGQAVEQWFLSRDIIPGDSGGGVFCRGKLTGIVWGANNPLRAIAFANRSEIEEFLGSLPVSLQGQTGLRRTD